MRHTRGPSPPRPSSTALALSSLCGTAAACASTHAPSPHAPSRAAQVHDAACTRWKLHQWGACRPCAGPPRVGSCSQPAVRRRCGRHTRRSSSRRAVQAVAGASRSRWLTAMHPPARRAGFRVLACRSSVRGAATAARCGAAAQSCHTCTPVSILMSSAHVFQVDLLARGGTWLASLHTVRRGGHASTEPRQ